MNLTAIPSVLLWGDSRNYSDDLLKSLCAEYTRIHVADDSFFWQPAQDTLAKRIKAIDPDITILLYRGLTHVAPYQIDIKYLPESCYLLAENAEDRDDGRAMHPYYGGLYIMDMFSTDWLTHTVSYLNERLKASGLYSGVWIDGCVPFNPTIPYMFLATDICGVWMWTDGIDTEYYVQPHRKIIPNVPSGYYFGTNYKYGRKPYQVLRENGEDLYTDKCWVWHPNVLGGFYARENEFVSVIYPTVAELPSHVYTDRYKQRFTLFFTMLREELGEKTQIVANIGSYTNMNTDYRFNVSGFHVEGNQWRQPQIPVTMQITEEFIK